VYTYVWFYVYTEGEARWQVGPEDSAFLGGESDPELGGLAALQVMGDHFDYFYMLPGDMRPF